MIEALVMKYLMKPTEGPAAEGKLYDRMVSALYYTKAHIPPETATQRKHIDTNNIKCTWPT